MARSTRRHSVTPSGRWTFLLGLVVLTWLPWGFCHSAERDEVAAWVEQLDDADFSRREAAVESLAALGSTAIDALVSAAQHGSPEAASRCVPLLERLMDSDDPAVVDAADAALVQLVGSDQPHAAALADAALDRKAEIREQRAIAGLTALGAQIQYAPEVDLLGRPLEGPTGDDPDLRPKTILLGRDWTGGVEGLSHLKKLSHLPDLILYVEKGSKVPPAQAQSLASVLPGLTVQSRGAYLGVGTQTDGTTDWAVGEVKVDGPAYKAGVQSGDHILALDDRPIQRFTDLVGLLEDCDPGDTVTITVERTGRVMDLKVELSAWKLDPVADNTLGRPMFQPRIIAPPRFPRLPIQPLPPAPPQ